MNLFQRAANQLNLTPAERALLRLIKTWLMTAISAGVIAGAQYLFANQQVDFVKLAYATGGALLLSFLMSAEKYYSAVGDLPLAVATGAVMSKVEQALPQEPAAQVTPVASVQPVATAGTTFPASVTLAATPASALVAQNANVLGQIHFGDTGIVPAVQAQQQQAK